MKKFFLILCMTFFFNANCQDMAKKLQHKTWYAVGDLLKNEVVSLNTIQFGNYTSDVEFLADGHLEILVKAIDVRVIASYEFKNEKTKIFYTISTTRSDKKNDVDLYYKIKELPDKKGFEFTPITETEFK